MAKCWKMLELEYKNSSRKTPKLEERSTFLCPCGFLYRTKWLGRNILPRNILFLMFNHQSCRKEWQADTDCSADEVISSARMNPKHFIIVKVNTMQQSQISHSMPRHWYTHTLSLYISPHSPKQQSFQAFQSTQNKRGLRVGFYKTGKLARRYGWRHMHKDSSRRIYKPANHTVRTLEIATAWQNPSGDKRMQSACGSRDWNIDEPGIAAAWLRQWSRKQCDSIPVLHHKG